QDIMGVSKRTMTRLIAHKMIRVQSFRSISRLPLLSDILRITDRMKRKAGHNQVMALVITSNSPIWLNMDLNKNKSRESE
ncbi:MAG: hypothetical protein V3U02_08150, partial [Calditrichia bacterium]